MSVQSTEGGGGEGDGGGGEGEADAKPPVTLTESVMLEW
tara:strand:+ start:610 stop:726 length:117 start_codon:yes stop_codon:yes gene_type:complete